MSVQNLTPIQKSMLSKDKWAIHTKHKITEQGLTAFLAEKGLDYESKTNIFVQGKQKPAFIVDFEAALYLALNRVDGPYSFEAYHRRNSKEQWAHWNENNRTPVQKLTQTPLMTGERLRGEALKEQKRKRLLAGAQRKAI